MPFGLSWTVIRENSVTQNIRTTILCITLLVAAPCRREKTLT